MDYEKELAALETQAKNKARKLGLERAAQIVATNSLAWAHDHDCTVLLDGFVVQSKCGLNPGGSPKVWIVQAMIKSDETLLYRQVNSEIVAFRDGPWVQRLLGEADRIKREIEDKAMSENQRRARERLENFTPIDF